MNQANDFFTSDSLQTFAGITFAVTVVGNAFRSLTNKDPKYSAFVTSVVICLTLAFAGVTLSTPSDYILTGFVGMINSCLVYCTAMGLTSQIAKAGKAEKPGEGTRRSSKPSWVTFFKPW